MTLEDIAKMTSVMITPAVAAKVIGCDPQFIRDAARSRPDLLCFKTMRIGSRTAIPRIPFLESMGYRPEVHTNETGGDSNDNSQHHL